ncbi:MAG: hypothetical protein ABIT38_24710 [Gemmatimonadaceae bacterium]
MSPDGENSQQEQSVMRWLLDSDPSIRWQVMRDLSDAPPNAVAAVRSRVAVEGWGAMLLARQRPDGNWGDGVITQHWRSNLYTLLRLRYLGVDPTSERVQKAIALTRDRVTWGAEFGDSPFFEGEVEPCINGGTLALGSYFGEPSDRLVDRLLGEQLTDGGWNCEAERGSVRSSFHSTICVLEGLLEYEKARGTTVDVTDARGRAHEYLLERRLLRKLSSGEMINAKWTRLTFPSMWQYDVLRGLSYLRDADVAPDGRMDEGVHVVEQGRLPDGRWPLDASPRDVFDGVSEDGVGEPNRWNTLRASRVLKWHSKRSKAATA